MSSHYAIPADVAHVVLEATDGQRLRIFVMRLPEGDPVALVGISALIWFLAADGDPAVAASVAASVDKPLDEIEATVEAYLADLVDQGLLRRTGTGQPG